MCVSIFDLFLVSLCFFFWQVLIAFSSLLHWFEVDGARPSEVLTLTQISHGFLRLGFSKI